MCLRAFEIVVSLGSLPDEGKIFLNKAGTWNRMLKLRFLVKIMEQKLDFLIKIMKLRVQEPLSRCAEIKNHDWLKDVIWF